MCLVLPPFTLVCLCLSLFPGVNFINILRAAFTLVDPESVKNTVKSSVSFHAFGIYEHKSCRILMKLSPCAKNDDSLKVVPTVMYSSVTNGQAIIEDQQINGNLALTSKVNCIHIFMIVSNKFIWSFFGLQVQVQISFKSIEFFNTCFSGKLQPTPVSKNRLQLNSVITNTTGPSIFVRYNRETL